MPVITQIFTDVGTHTLQLPSGLTSIEYLVVAGGGGGGDTTVSYPTSSNGCHGGGGAAGGMREGTVNNPNGGTYTIIVGSGTAWIFGRGNPSSIAGSSINVSTTGGGRGGSAYINGAGNGNSGGSGGGAGCGGNNPAKTGGAGTSGEGNTGANGGINFGSSGGGGGKNAVGSGVNGGAGKSNSITGSAVIYAAGGNGVASGAAEFNGTAGTANRGNGGQGSSSVMSNHSGGAGGSGIVVLKYTIPVNVITSGVTTYEYTQANLYGNVTSTGITITQRGFCWSTGATPTTGNTHITAGSGTGNYNAIATNLKPNTLYNVRAYVVFTGSVMYGNTVQFTTHVAPKPIIISAQTKLVI